MLWELPKAADDFIKVLTQIEWVQSDIGDGEIDFSSSDGKGSDRYDLNDKKITEYDEFEGEGDTEVTSLKSRYKPTEIVILFKKQKKVLFENNGEDQYLVKLADESIGLLNNYDDVLKCVSVLLGK